MNGLIKNYSFRLPIIVFIFIVSATAVSLFYTKSAYADWYSDLGSTYTVYKQGSDFIYWNGKDGSWKMLNPTSSANIPKVLLNGKSCQTADDTINFYESKVFYNCTGLVITASNQSNFFKQANLAYIIGDFDSRETANVDGGKVTQMGTLNDVAITNGGYTAHSRSYGCTGGNPNKNQACSILVVFNYASGDSFRLDLGVDSTNYLAGLHEYYYDGPSMGVYHTLTFDPNGGSVTDYGGDDALILHKSSNKALREYIENDTSKNYPAPTRSGWKFQGWCEESTGSICTQHTQWKMGTNHTLYAHWTPAIVVIPKWSVTPTVSCNVNGAAGTVSTDGATSNNNIPAYTSARVGQTINCSHVATVNPGSSPLDRVDHFTYQNKFSYINSSGSPIIFDTTAGPYSNHWLPINSVAGFSSSFSSDAYTVQTGDAGKTLCRRTNAEFQAWNSLSPTYSSYRCFYVPKEWYIKPSVLIDKNTANPRDVIKWDHWVNNTASNATTIPVPYYYQEEKRNEDDTVIPDSGSFGNRNHIFPANSLGKSTVFYSDYTVLDEDVGKKICRRTNAIPQAWDNSSEIQSDYKCSFVPYHYELTPIVSFDTLTTKIIEPGSNYKVNLKVKKTGTYSRPTSQWLTKTIGSGSPEIINEYTKDTFIFTLPETTLDDLSQTAPDEPAGTQVCYTLYVKARSDSNPNEISDKKCVKIGKKPKVNIEGGDLLVGGLVKTSTTDKNVLGLNYRFGSWAEYGIIAKKSIIGAGSGAAFAKSGLAINVSNDDICKSSKLSFANTLLAGTSCNGLNDSIGYYTNTSAVPNVAANFPDTTDRITGNVVLNSKNSGTYMADNVTLGLSELGQGKSIIIKATGTVTINGNQTYKSNGYSKISQIPQLVIIAKTINITNDVTQIDAWLITNQKGSTDDNYGSINTCSDVPITANLSTNMCNNKLTVNGPVMTDKLYLRRTAGSETGANSSNPAEVFNLRADSYLWAFAQASKNGRIHTVYTTELPPRL